MTFNSLSFLIFFPLVAAAYFLLPHRFRPLLLLAASMYFYSVFVPWYLLVLFFLIVVDYAMGLMIEGRAGQARKAYLFASIAANLGALFVFKYVNFFNETIRQLAAFFDFHYSFTVFSLLIPIGLSFHVFQSLSYVIEVYRAKYPAERNFLIYALYVMFFPQLMAGPIERPQHLLPQFREVHPFDAGRVSNGLKTMLWGFFKKLVIADTAAIAVNHVYANLHMASGPLLVVITILFAYELYGDFSGYSDIAIGSARVLGFDLVQNFNRPYTATSIPEFWRRWHMSLSSWLRDYLYYPLAFSFRKPSRITVYVSLLVTFLAIGLWHGPNWTYVLMGGLHGAYLVLSDWSKSWRKALVAMARLEKFPRWHRGLRIVITFTLVSASWILFRAQNLSDAWFLFSHISAGFSRIGDSAFLQSAVFSESALGMPAVKLLVLVASILLMHMVETAQAEEVSPDVVAAQPIWLRWGVYYAVIFAILLFGAFGSQTFIYFQF